MKLEKRSERMQNIIDGACEAALLVAFLASVYGLMVILFALDGPK